MLFLSRSKLFLLITLLLSLTLNSMTVHAAPVKKKPVIKAIPAVNQIEKGLIDSYNKAVTASENKQYEVAEKQLLQAKSLAEKIKHPQLYVVYEKMGQVKYHLGQYSEAASYTLKSLPGLKAKYGLLSQQVAYVYYMMGAINTALLNYSEAKNYYQQVLEIEKQLASPETDMINRIEKSNLLLEENTPILNEGTRDGALYNSAVAAYDNKQYDQALSLFQKLIDHYPQSPSLPNALTRVGGIYEDRKNHTAAEPVLLKAIQKMSLKPSYYSLTLMSALDNLGLCYFSQGKMPQAQAIFKRRLAMETAIHGSNSTEALKIQKLLAESKNSHTEESYIHALGQKLVRWHDETKVINVYFEPAEAIKGWKPELDTWVKQAFEKWFSVLDNRLTVEYVADPGVADVIIEWAEKPLAANADNEEKVGENRRLNWGDSYFLSNNLYLTTMDGKGAAHSPALCQNIILHEIGHLLGLEHSPSPSDVMYPNSLGKTLSERDKTTLKELYQTKATITNPPNIHLAEFKHYTQVVQEAQALADKNQYASALETLDRAQSLYNKDPISHYLASLCLFRLQRYEEAIIEGERGVSLSSDTQADALNVLAVSHYNYGILLERDSRKNKDLAKIHFNQAKQYAQDTLKDTTLNIADALTLRKMIQQIDEQARNTAAPRSSQVIFWE